MPKYTHADFEEEMKKYGVKVRSYKATEWPDPKKQFKVSWAEFEYVSPKYGRLIAKLYFNSRFQRCAVRFSIAGHHFDLTMDEWQDFEQKILVRVYEIMNKFNNPVKEEERVEARA